MPFFRKNVVLKLLDRLYVLKFMALLLEERFQTT